LRRIRGRVAGAAARADARGTAGRSRFPGPCRRCGGLPGGPATHAPPRSSSRSPAPHDLESLLGPEGTDGPPAAVVRVDTL